jgi:hypothetical protein
MGESGFEVVFDSSRRHGHGGLNTALESLSGGVPAIEEVLTNPWYHANAQRLQRLIAAKRGVGQAAAS